MSTLFLGNFVQFFDDNGDPLSGGTVTFYEPGTATPKDVYSDSGLGTPLGSEVTLDSAGRATIFLNGDYKARLEDSEGALVDETDNINPPVETETSGGNLIANGSFETQGNAATEADGWTLTPQSDGSVERVTTDNYDGEACLKFTSDGSGGGQADTNAFFPVSPGRTYGVSFALKCSVADIRNIVQVRYFDKDQAFLSNSTVYDEDTSNPTSWTIKRFSETPPANARFAKVRILGADQSDATAGNARFDSVAVNSSSQVAGTFPNVAGKVTANEAELNKLDGYTGTTADMNAVLVPYSAQRIELGGDFDAGEEVVCERIGNTVTITAVNGLSHTSKSAALSSGVIPSQFRPTEGSVYNVTGITGGQIQRTDVNLSGDFRVTYYDYTGSLVAHTVAQQLSISFVITGNIS